MKAAQWIGSLALITVAIGAAGGLAAWKSSAMQASQAAAAMQPEPMEMVTAAVAEAYEHRRTTTAIGTVLALRSVTLSNELPGTVREVTLTPGAIVEAGTLLVALDVSVEQAELTAQEAQARYAQFDFARIERLFEDSTAASIELERARAERDTALANVERLKAIIERKTIRAPFRARIGMVDLHPGQYLDAGTEITTLQGVDDGVHVDFTVAQHDAAGLQIGGQVEVLAPSTTAPVAAEIIALDARIDPATRNATVRALIEGPGPTPTPGAAVRVRVPVGAPQKTVVVPVSSVRKGPGGDHVFVIAPDDSGKPRAHLRPVKSGAMVGDRVLLAAGVEPGEQVAASGAFKLREGVLVAIANDPQAKDATTARR